MKMKLELLKSEVGYLLKLLDREVGYCGLDNEGGRKASALYGNIRGQCSAPDYEEICEMPSALKRAKERDALKTTADKTELRITTETDLLALAAAYARLAKKLKHCWPNRALVYRRAAGEIRKILTQ
jgi:hypothetical protein